MRLQDDMAHGVETKRCEQCGDAYRRNKKYGHRQWESSRFCSSRCVGASNAAKRVDVECPSCGKPFSLLPSHAQRRKYCSRKCATEGRRSGMYTWRNRYRVEDHGFATSCWVFTGGTANGGYGSVRIDGAHYFVHQLAYEAEKGALPDGFQVDHLCRVRACMNPDHLEAVPPAVNTRRGVRTKMTQSQVDAIRRSSATCVALAEEYGVAESTISNIRNWHSWKTRSDGFDCEPLGQRIASSR